MHECTMPIPRNSQRSFEFYFYFYAGEKQNARRVALAWVEHRSTTFKQFNYELDAERPTNLKNFNVKEFLSHFAPQQLHEPVPYRAARDRKAAASRSRAAR
jgi:hypothetical protein